MINKQKFAIFVKQNVYWWGNDRPSLDVDAVLRFILAKRPRYVEEMARKDFGFTDNDFRQALRRTPPGLFWGVGAEEKWNETNRRLGIEPPLPFPRSSVSDWIL